MYDLLFRLPRIEKVVLIEPTARGKQVTRVPTDKNANNIIYAV